MEGRGWSVIMTSAGKEVLGEGELTSLYRGGRNGEGEVEEKLQE